jgi:glycine betaine/choline ABC-type transport system substrate-binding protein
MRIGTKNFTEQFILGELMKQTVEARTDLRVELIANLSGTTICHQALTGGRIDAYAEYTGTALTAILKEAAIPDPQRVASIVGDAYRERFDCRWLAPFGFNNTYAVAVRADDARMFGWRRIGDLTETAADMTAGFTAEFSERADGYPGLRAAYGFEFGEARDLDPGLMYRAIAEGEVDVICAFATDGRIAAYNLTLLEDDRSFFPPYEAAPVVRVDFADRHPEAVAALESLAGRLDDATMRRLNHEVDEKKRDPADVAREFLAGIEP